MGVGVEYGFNMVSMSLLKMRVIGSLPIDDQASIYGYLNTDNSSSVAMGRGFAVVNYVLKIQPNSLYGYSFEASKIPILYKLQIHVYL